MLSQIEPSRRIQAEGNIPALLNPGEDKCIHRGMDQGLHNWLIYSGKLDKYMEVGYKSDWLIASSQHNMV
jgi:hypothetical protein